MGYFDNALYFFYTSKTVADLSNQSWAAAAASPHLIFSLAEYHLAPNCDAHISIILQDLKGSITVRLLTIIPVSFLRYTNVYVDNFIALVQVVPEDWRRVREHVFHSIDRVFKPNATG